MNIAVWIDSARLDLLYGLRQLVLNRSFAAIAILSLALGIGANTAIFQLVDAIRLTTLPVYKPEELVSVDFSKGARRPGAWYGRGDAVSYAQWEQIRDRQQSFSSVAAWSPDRFNLAVGGEPRMADGLHVSSDFFRVLGVQPFVGRTFTAQDDNAACDASTVLSYAFWQREFGGASDILQRTVRVGGHVFPVIGVTAPAFFGVQVGKQFDLALPICADRLLADDARGRMSMSFAWWLSIIGRLKPGWTAASATADLHTISKDIMEAIDVRCWFHGLVIELPCPRTLRALLSARRLKTATRLRNRVAWPRSSTSPARSSLLHGNAFGESHFFLLAGANGEV